MEGGLGDIHSLFRFHTVRILDCDALDGMSVEAVTTLWLFLPDVSTMGVGRVKEETLIEQGSLEVR